MSKPLAAGALAGEDQLALAGGGAAQLPAGAGAKGAEMQRMLPGSGDTLEQAKQVVATDPRVAAQVIKSWVGD